MVVDVEDFLTTYAVHRRASGDGIRRLYQFQFRDRGLMSSEEQPRTLKPEKQPIDNQRLMRSQTSWQPLSRTITSFRALLPALVHVHPSVHLLL